MLRRAIVLSLLVVTTLAAVIGWTGWRHERQRAGEQWFLRQQNTFLRQENSRLQKVLSERQRATDSQAIGVARHEIEQAVAVLRDLKFQQPVNYREVPRSELPAILRQKLAQQVPDQEFQHTGIALAALGFIPRGLDLKATYLDLLGEQVGAFYDQHTLELVTFQGQSLANSQNRTILAHELTHALEDQHFGLERLPLEAKGNDDRALAASALVEGDATLVMNRFLLGNLTAAAVRENLAATATTDVRKLSAAPRYLRETLLFPYLRGLEFCQTLFDRGGWRALDQAFEHPPSSTAQILHPERYLAEPREEPVAVEFPESNVLGTTPISDNVLGEIGLRQFLGVRLKSDVRAAEVAAGWQGDHCLVYGDTVASSYVWEIAWRLPGQAEQFLEVCRAMLANRSKENGSQRFFLAVDPARRRTIFVSAQDERWLKGLLDHFVSEYPQRDAVSL